MPPSITPTTEERLPYASRAFLTPFGKFAQGETKLFKTKGPTLGFCRELWAAEGSEICVLLHRVGAPCRGDRESRKWGGCLVKTHQHSSGGILTQPEGPAYIELVYTWKSEQVKSKCQFKARLIKEQQRTSALLLARNSPCCQAASQAPLPSAVISRGLSPASSHRTGDLLLKAGTAHAGATGRSESENGEGSAGRIGQPWLPALCLLPQGNMCCTAPAGKRREKSSKSSLQNRLLLKRGF